MSDAAPPESPALPDATSAKPLKPARHGLSRSGWWLCAILVLVFGAVGTSAYWLPLVQPYFPVKTQSDDGQAALAARLAAIERKLDALQSLNDRVTNLERHPAPDANAAIAPVADQLQLLTARLDRAETRLDRAETRLAELLKAQTARGDSAQRVLIVALADLGNAVSSSRPFAAQLASVEALGQGRGGWAMALHPLEDAARNGIPSVAVLAQRFSNETAPAILRADAAAPDPQASLGETMLSKLRSLVIIRRTDGQGGTASGAEGAVATAEAALDKGDLDGAVTALGALSGAPANAAASWLAQAQQRLQAEQIIAKLTQELSSDLAAGTGGG
jgi:hypothetical protein